MAEQKIAARREVMAVVIAFGKRRGALCAHQPSKCRREKHTRTARTIEDALLQRIASGERLFDDPIRQQPRCVIGALPASRGCTFPSLRFCRGFVAEERFVNTSDQFDWNLREIIAPKGGLTRTQHGAAQEMAEILERIRRQAAPHPLLAAIRSEEIPVEVLLKLAKQSLKAIRVAAL
jgi:hypothetical protein